VLLQTLNNLSTFAEDHVRLHHCVYAAFVLGSTVGTAGAQSANLPPRRFGLTAGVNSSTIGGSDVGNASRRTGFMAGALIVIPVSPTFAIQPELLYTMKGATSNDVDVGSTFKMNYAEIPVLLRVDIPASGGTKPFFYGGPAVSFKVSCDIEATSQGSTVSASCDELESQGVKVKTVDYGVVVGGGLAFDVGGRAFTIGARYDHSLGKIVEDSDSKHRVISILATLEFPWAK
jgi:hypothetical protein